MASKISVFIIVVAMVVLAGVLGDTASEDSSINDSERPKTYSEVEANKLKPVDFLFENYPLSEERYVGPYSDIDFSTNPLAKNFEEIIISNVESIGVNFAGTYSIASWSCGSDCQNSAIINLQDGSIHTYGLISSHGLSFSPDSTLLIINPKENISDREEGEVVTETDYYSIDEEKLIFQGKEISGKGIVDDCIQAIANARNKITNEVVEFSTPCAVPFGWELIP